MKESYRYNLLRIMCMVLCIGCLLLYAVSSVSGAEGQQIGSIQVIGNRSIGSERILPRIRSRVGEPFNSATAAEDVKRISELPGVQTSYYNDNTVVDDKIQLVFVVVERNIVRSISFTGNRKYKDKTLRKKTDFKKGDYLDPLLAESSVKAVTDFYNKKGFAFAKVDMDTEKLQLGQLVYAVAEGPRVKIKSVRFSGNSKLKTRGLKKTIKTKKRKFLVFTKYYTEKAIDKDLLKLRNVYHKRGFLDSKITVRPQFNEAKNKVSLTFVIEEGPVYTVEEINILGNEHFDTEQLTAEMRLQRSAPYSEQMAELEAKRLAKLYHETCCIDTRVQDNRRCIAEGKVNAGFEVTEGGRFRIGLIDISGNEQTHDKVIRRILDEYDFQPGNWYNADIARGDGRGELEKRIQRMILTPRDGAVITPSGDAPDQRDAQVNVIEGQTGSIMLGAGVASDSGVIGQLVFEQRNFDIHNKPESLMDFITGRAFKGAGQNLRIALSPGTEISEYSISFTEPYLKNKPISLNVVASSWERWRESYDEGRTKGYVGFEKRYRNRWRRSISFRVENVEVDDLDIDAPKEIIDVKGDTMLAGIKLGVTKDMTDDIFYPSKGFIFDADYEQVGGDFTFGVLSATYRKYRTLHEDLAERKTILATKLHAATILGDAPPFEMFYAGGQRSIRGFDYRGVSTRGLPTVGGVPQTGLDRKDPIGSDWIFLANTEVVVPLVGENLGIVFFVDSGAIDTGNYRAAVGTGIQIMLPQWFGPVPMRFELAAPLMKDDEDETQVFSFSVGRLF